MNAQLRIQFKILNCYLFKWIDVVFLPRVAAHDAKKSYARSFPDSVLQNSLSGIFGTGRIKDAAPFCKNRNIFLIKTN
jgi:hypothetical protein